MTLKSRKRNNSIVVALFSALLLCSHLPSSEGSNFESRSNTIGLNRSTPTPSPSSTTKNKSKKKKSSKTSSSPKIGNFGYTGKKDPSDINVPHMLDTLTGGSLNNLVTGFKLPAEVSASTVMQLIQTDLSSANLSCETVVGSLPDLPFTFAGSVTKDSVAVCENGDPLASGFYEFILTDPVAVSKYNTVEGAKAYINYLSPELSQYPFTYFTPSNRAIIFTVGSQFAFDANEISWATLYNSGYAPPTR
jgi:hypothetical protein